MCVFFSVLQVCVNAACVPAEKFHSRCIILSLWDPSLSSSRIWFGMSVCVCVCVCVCVRASQSVCVCARVSVCSWAPPLLPGPESSTHLGSECALRPHIVPRFYEGASQSIPSILSGEKGNTCHGGGRSVPLDHRRHATHTAAPLVLAEPRTAKQQEGNKRRSQSGEYSEPNLSGGPLSRQHCLCCPLLLEGTVRWGTADSRAGSQLVTVRDDRTGAKGGCARGAPARISMLTAGLES